MIQVIICGPSSTAFFPFFFHPFRSFASSLPPVSSYCPERGIVFHPPPPHFFAPNPHPLSRGVHLFYEIVASAHTRALFRAIFFYHLAASPLADSIFSNGWTSRGHSAVTTGPDKEQQTGSSCSLSPFDPPYYFLSRIDPDRIVELKEKDQNEVEWRFLW